MMIIYLVTGYAVTDVNGDDLVDRTDVSIAFNNSNFVLGSSIKQRIFNFTKVEVKNLENIRIIK